MAAIDLTRPDGPPLILASASPARARLLRAAGVPVDQRPAAVDEAAVKEALQAERTPPDDGAVTLAVLKAARVAAQAPPDALVIGADQVLTCEGRWYDKPGSRSEARNQLCSLAGRRHELWTAAVVFQGEERLWHHVAEGRLWMRPLSDAFIDVYLGAAGEAVLNSVGAYHLEGPGAQLFARVQGDAFAIQGLPLLQLLEFLRVRGALPV